MKFNFKKGFVLVIFLIFLAGCIPGDSGRPRNGGRAVGGNTGVVINFEDVPREIFEGRSFYVSVNLENPTTEAVSGTLTLYDEDDDLFGGVPTGGDSQSFSLLGAEMIDEKVSPEAPLQLEFGPYSYDSSDKIRIKDNLRGTVIRAKVNYDDYPVSIRVPICVESTRNREGGCRESPEGRITKLGRVASFAPVTIKSIDRSIAPGEGDKVSLYLDLLLVNQGGGKIDNLEEELGFSINSVSSGNIFSCQPSAGKISLRRPKLEKLIKCVADIEISEGYRNDFLRVDLDYPYEFEVDAVQIPIVPEFLEND